MRQAVYQRHGESKQHAYFGGKSNNSTKRRSHMCFQCCFTPAVGAFATMQKMSFPSFAWRMLALERDCVQSLRCGRRAREGARCPRAQSLLLSHRRTSSRRTNLLACASSSSLAFTWSKLDIGQAPNQARGRPSAMLVKIVLEGEPC